MTNSKDKWLLAAGVLGPACVCLTAWLADALIGGGSWPVRVGMMCAGMLPAGAALALLLHRAKADRRVVEQHFEALFKFDLCDLSLDGDQEVPPPLPADNPWLDIADRVLKTFEECRHRTRELKHTRTAWEIRCQRATRESDRIKTILSGLTEPVLAVDAFDELILANTAAKGLFNFDANGTEKRALAQLVGCEKLVDLLKSTCRRKAAASRSEEIEIVDEKGNSRWFCATVSQLQPPAGDDDPAETSGRGAVAV
ncbi:MAG: hypothetical protein ABIK89_06735, partial [Planctomycetota bacterium]